MDQSNSPSSTERASEERWRRFVPRRTPWQFSLRTLLLVVLVASVGLSLLAVKLQRDRRHHRAMAGLKKAGARVDTGNNGWVRSVDLGFRMEGAGARFDPEVAPVRNAELALLKDLPKLEELNLVQAGTGDEGLEHLAGVGSLRGLNLMSTRITDAGLVHLSRLSRLEELNLTQTRITDAGLEQLKGLKNLRTLNLQAGKYHEPDEWDPKITDAGLQHLRGLTRLEALNLYAARVSDGGLVHLKQLTNLRELNLGHVIGRFDAVIVMEDGGIHLRPVSDFPAGTTWRFDEVTDLEQITDAGLVHLKDLTKLEKLNLSNTLVSDDGLAHLGAMSNLRELVLRGTRVTYEGVEKLQQDLLDCRIIY